MHQSFITATGISDDALASSLMDFANLYAGEGFANDIEIYRKKGDHAFLILFTNSPSFDHFCYTVNYVRHTKTPDHRWPLVYGYYLNELNDDPFLTEGFVKAYVSSKDTAHDNVNVVNGNNETYLFDFAGSQQRLAIIEETFEVPTVNMDDYQHILNIIPAPAEVKPWWKIW